MEIICCLDSNFVKSLYKYILLIHNGTMNDYKLEIYR